MATTSSPHYFITIGRSYGSGGLRLAEELQKALGVPMYDKNLLDLTAKETNIQTDILQRVDERNTRTFPYIYDSGYPMTNAFYTYTSGFLSDESLFGRQCATIEHIAAEGSAIFVGRCSDYVLREQPCLLSIFVTDDIDRRATRVMERLQMTRDEAIAQIDKIDKQRREYYSYYTTREWGVAENYDLCVKLSRFGTDYVVRLVKDMVAFMVDKP
ncbi:AAA family ATPase [Porphyromonas sp.]|uniref:cytidylate kinase-like family protein n=1 Tax=Porphyromonas sp. TaxID=1924944 RepID=UPI0026DCCFD3|nr:cytidylate kinase-like family protein [Porphyromonas sp.]MDO4770876.1 cytidylate kinase-like family protein [Porphyromonas sp.]